jgi:glycine dehydrogenase subunit 1
MPNEFVVKTPQPASAITKRLLDKKIVGGLALDAYYPEMNHSLLLCVTETTKKDAIDNLVAALAE